MFQREIIIVSLSTCSLKNLYRWVDFCYYTFAEIAAHFKGKEQDATASEQTPAVPDDRWSYE
jgi:hypothetical protein